MAVAAAFWVAAGILLGWAVGDLWMGEKKAVEKPGG